MIKIRKIKKPFTNDINFAKITIMKNYSFIDYYRSKFRNVIHNDDSSAIKQFAIEDNTRTKLLWPCVLYRVEVQSAKMLLDILLYMLDILYYL